MSNLFILVTFLSMMAIFYFGIRAVISVIRKNKTHRTKMLKSLAISGVVMFISAGIGGSMIESEEEVSQDKVEDSKEDKKIEVVKQELTDEEKAAIEIKRKEEEEAKKVEAQKAEEERVKAEATKKAKKEEAKAAEKTHYVNDILPQIEAVMTNYDTIWSEIWQPTFSGLGTTVNVYTAYENMGSLVNRYKALEDQIYNIDGAKLSKDNKKLLESFKSDFRSASSMRRAAGKDAQKIIDKGVFSPSEMDDLKNTISYSEAPMMNALISKVKLDEKYGIKN